MIRLAEVRARQQRPGEAAQALEAAYVTGQPQTGDLAVANLYKVAERLERWNFLTEARSFADRGRTLAGPLFLTGRPSSPDASSDGTQADSPEADSSPEEDTDEVPVAKSLETPSNAALYARIVARQGHAEEALATLVAARRQAAQASPSVLTGLVQTLADRNSPEARRDLADRRKLAI